jgi:hypothetical protein
MPNAVDADARDGDAFERAQQNTAERVPKGGAISGLEWLDAITAVVLTLGNSSDCKSRSLQQRELPP